MCDRNTWHSSDHEKQGQASTFPDKSWSGTLNLLWLIIKKGLTDNDCQLPEYLQGHMFLVGPVGAIDSYKHKNLPYIVEPAHGGLSIPRTTMPISRFITIPSIKKTGQKNILH